jgi:hypothetical protein
VLIRPKHPKPPRLRLVRDDEPSPIGQPPTIEGLERAGVRLMVLAFALSVSMLVGVAWYMGSRWPW